MVRLRMRQTTNGQYLMEIIEEHNPILLNKSDLCQGLITRRRVTINSIEERTVKRIFSGLFTANKIFEF